jgi:hypothetical protein
VRCRRWWPIVRESQLQFSNSRTYSESSQKTTHSRERKTVELPIHLHLKRTPATIGVSPRGHEVPFRDWPSMPGSRTSSRKILRRASQVVFVKDSRCSCKLRIGPSAGAACWLVVVGDPVPGSSIDPGWACFGSLTEAPWGCPILGPAWPLKTAPPHIANRS